MLTKEQLQNHLEKVAASHTICPKSNKSTYPVPGLLDDFAIIEQVYQMLNEHLKLGIHIHPAGEWLLDNFYIIEETVKQIQKELTLKKYTNFVGIAQGEQEGFARIYVLAAEIVAYTDGKIERENLKDYLISYQAKKTLSMDEIWNIGIFLQIVLIQKITEICTKIASSQAQKYRVENIVERLVENKPKAEQIFKNTLLLGKERKEIFQDMRYPFIEYMSYTLKRYGKKGIGYLSILEETVEKLGLNLSEVIQKEHFEIAVQKVLMGNSITSIKKIGRINFLEIFEQLNGVEDLLKQDPAQIYDKMDHKTKEYYRNKIKEISQKTKISEMYIAKKVIALAREQEKGTKASHIGYYLIRQGINSLYEALEYRQAKEMTPEKKTKLYETGIILGTIILSGLISLLIYHQTQTIWSAILSFLLFLLPASEICLQLVQTILNRLVKPKLIPKLDCGSGIPEENATMVVIPTIIQSAGKVKELMRKLEVYYLANQSENLYFTLLGDCSQSDKEEEEFDQEVIEEGIKQTKLLNQKYQSETPIFSFIYRKRTWNEKEKCYLGWERKRGLLNQFNKYLLGKQENPFRVNTREEIENQPAIRYIITLDADTDLILNSAFELVGAMAHPLNTPVIDKEKQVVIDGYGIMQPRVGINLDISQKTVFTKIFAGAGGIDNYTNAISDIYQDNFKEGIFTGKGIYDLAVFSQVLSGQIPENTVLSHDLLEGCYLRCGLVSDVMLMDGYPTKYTSFMTRLARWIRGDWQITKWLTSKSLNQLSKYKIWDNLRRSLLEIGIMVDFIYLILLSVSLAGKQGPALWLLTLTVILPFILEGLNHVIFKKEGEQKQKTFTPKITGIKGILLRALLTIGCLPNKAMQSAKAIGKTIYRMLISHEHLLEWTTSEEAEKQAKTDLVSYYRHMIANIVFGALAIVVAIWQDRIGAALLGVLWLITPSIMFAISKEVKQKSMVQTLPEKDQNYLIEVAYQTWNYFETYLTEENHYLIPDNYQEDRKQKIVSRTSSTNIGLSLLAVISAYDLQFISLETALKLLISILRSIESLPKWNGHLYNWYQIKTKEPLIPRYVSTVDSGNFIGYLYTTKAFLSEVLVAEEETQTEQEENQEKNQETTINLEEIETQIKAIDSMIKNTDFKPLYEPELRLFSIGYNIEENKLTDSYYDLLASEARQASLVAIAKKDVPVKHWNSLSRTLTTLGKYKGLISWSGTSFEYLMPNINIPKYQGSLLDESCRFMLMSQMEYAKKLQIPWGISEAAFNLKDLHANYQYKAFGIPWLGLKRGLADEMVVAPYGSILAVSDIPQEVMTNLKQLESYGMKGKYGFYESIDFTPERVEKGKQASVVKTYMAHHQSLILLSINNLINDQIFPKRFMHNPEIEAIQVLLQETMPETFIITKENKEKVEKPKYKDYEDYSQVTYEKFDERLIRGNVIANEDYTIIMNQKGEGVSKYKNLYVNRFRSTEDYPQGIFLAFKNIHSKKLWSSWGIKGKENHSKISFMPDKIKQEIREENIKTKIETIISPNDPVEIRKVTLENLGQNEEIIEVTGYLEPILSHKEQDDAHPAFNQLFLLFDYDEKSQSIVVRRKKREEKEEDVYLSVGLFTSGETIGDLEYEIDGEKLNGRANIGIPQMIQNSIPFSQKTGLVTEATIALKRTIKLKPEEKTELVLLLSLAETREKAIDNNKKYQIQETIQKTFELSKAQVEAQSRYLRMKGKEIESYQKMISYIIFQNPSKVVRLAKVAKRHYEQSDLWKYGVSGDLPIILVKIRDVNDSYVVQEVLKAYEFFRTKKIDVEIVILDEERHSYENYVKEEIEEMILNEHMVYLKNNRGGIFTLTKSEMEKKDLELFNVVASLVIDSSKGGIESNLHDIEEEYLEKTKPMENEKVKPVTNEDTTKEVDIFEHAENFHYYNEYGGFVQDGSEYWMQIKKGNRLPMVWSHILANEKFGTLVTENMGGYTWYRNSRLNRMTSWENQPNLDIPSEIIFLKDEETKKTWSIGCSPKPDDKNYQVIYGFGFAEYWHKSEGLEQKVEVFVPKEDSVKVQIVTLKNTTPNRKKMKLIYYAKPVMGEDEKKSDGYLTLTWEENSNLLWMRNLYNRDFPHDILSVSCSEKITSYTGNKSFFLGKGEINDPDGLKKASLNQENSIGRKPCIAYETEIEIESFGQKEIVLTLGAEENLIDCKNIAYKYSKVANSRRELDRVKNDWKERLTKIQVSTPLESTNILLNGWIMYQIINSRLLGRTGYYQSGGALGFRDQLQDTLALLYTEPEMTKRQILKHAAHQFPEGDGEHWWHEETGRGIRTRFSDDRLWLPYLMAKYIEVTGDKSILKVQAPYRQGKPLEEGQDEKYDKYEETNETESLYEHAIKAIKISLNFGENGLPKIGSGDWNDGFNKVGNQGKGESVWLGFFLYEVLNQWIPIIKQKEESEQENRKQEEKETHQEIEKKQENQEEVKVEETNRKWSEELKEIQLHLKKALNTKAWDGRWYKRAYMDNGSALGSMENDECRIDSIAQSWSTISGAGDNDKKYISMESLENHLVDRENGIIKLLDPPFEKGKLEPGYIKSYLPGVRENGGQYTHASCWVIIAEAMLGFGDKALELYRMINPIEHSRTKDAVNKYKVEPYVIPADIYGAGNLAGRGGWTWYTGSASWYYLAGIVYILGLTIKAGVLSIHPCIPKDWKEYQIHLKWKNSVYHVTVKNPEGKNTEVKQVLLDGHEVENAIRLEENGVYQVEVILG